VPPASAGGGVRAYSFFLSHCAVSWPSGGISSFRMRSSASAAAISIVDPENWTSG